MFASSKQAWHAWAVMNFEACHHYKHMQNNTSESYSIGPSAAATAAVGGAGLTSQMISKYAVPALKGFVRSIALSKGSSLQDTLRLLTLLFDYGHQADMYEALHEG